MKRHPRSHSSATFIRLLMLIAIALAAVAATAPHNAAAAPAQVDLEFNGTDIPATLNGFLATTLPSTNAPNGGATVHTDGSGPLQILASARGRLPIGTGQDNPP